HRALFGGGHDGLEVPRAVLAWARHLLRPGGVLIMEHADVQGEGTRSAAAEVGGFDLLRTVPDLTGRDRFLVARRAPGEPTSGSERLSRGPFTTPRTHRPARLTSPPPSTPPAAVACSSCPRTPSTASGRTPSPPTPSPPCSRRRAAAATPRRPS